MKKSGNLAAVGGVVPKWRLERQVQCGQAKLSARKMPQQYIVYISTEMESSHALEIWPQCHAGIQ